MKIRLRMTDGKREWWEPHDVPEDDAHKWAKKVTDRFNETLRPGELARTLLEVVIDSADRNTGAHEWIKTSVYMQQQGKSGRMFDEYRCVGCGITGRRYGLSPTIHRDAPYRYPRYEDCEWSRAQLNRLREKASRRNRV